VKFTVDVSNKTLQEAMRLTKAKTRKDVVEVALSEFIQRRRMRRLARTLRPSGTFMTHAELMASRKSNRSK
jgi:Arc/MetJ family transcription regulator